MGYIPSRAPSDGTLNALLGSLGTPSLTGREHGPLAPGSRRCTDNAGMHYITGTQIHRYIAHALSQCVQSQDRQAGIDMALEHEIMGQR